MGMAMLSIVAIRIRAKISRGLRAAHGRARDATGGSLPASLPGRQRLRAQQWHKSCCGHWRVCWRDVSVDEGKVGGGRSQAADRDVAAPANHDACIHSYIRPCLLCTYLETGDALFGGVLLLELPLLSLLSCFTAGLLDAMDADAIADKAGNWRLPWLAGRCWVKDATVDVDEGREISRPMDGNEGLSSSTDAVLKAGRSRTCRIDGRRNESMAVGRGRIEDARAEAVVCIRMEKRLAASLTVFAGRRKRRKRKEQMRRAESPCGPGKPGSLELGAGSWELWNSE